MIDRRRILTGLAAGALLSRGRLGIAQTLLARDPFTLGVASGNPTAGGVVLWTRLAMLPLDPAGGMPREIVPVTWEVAADEGMARVVRQGTAFAEPDWAHSVHVEVDGLEPARWYWYRFRAAGIESPIGRTRTAPAPGSLEPLRFAFASCAHYEQGWFSAYRHMAAEAVDLVVHLGDYIYERSYGRDHVRKFGAPEPITLDDYRARYALYKLDPDLRAAHAACPWIVTWDDHEVSNDYADWRSETLDPPDWFLQRRAAAYRAYYEHMPLPRSMVPLGPHARIHQQASFGGLVDFHVLDDRQFRSPQPCARPGRGGANTLEGCAARLDPALTLLGAPQEAWLADNLGRSRARWNVVAQQTLMAQLDRKPGDGQRFWTDGWDGYPAARRRLLDTIVERLPPNPIVISGDVHTYFVADLKPDFDDPASPVVASEFVGGSITSQLGTKQADLDAMRPENPHIKLADLTRHGYVRMTVTAERTRADLRVVASTADPNAGCETLASFVVEDGRPGPVPA